MVKGGGAALTREKIVADLAERFVCIADQSKLVEVMGRFPLPVEVIPMAAAQVARRFAAAYGGAATVRAGVTTDNGNLILDVRGLQITDPLAMETEVNQWPGVGDGGHLRPPPGAAVPTGHARRRASPVLRLTRSQAGHPPGGTPRLLPVEVAVQPQQQVQHLLHLGIGPGGQPGLDRREIVGIALPPERVVLCGQQQAPHPGGRAGRPAGPGSPCAAAPARSA